LSGDFDVAVVGSGFAGSLFALVARAIGRSVVLLEKGRHPRFAIGESSSPLANLLLDQLCRRYGLDRIRPFSAWASWVRSYPEVDCGLKRGFTFFGHAAGEPRRRNPARTNELLVAASPRDAVADTHWNRADFDHFLAREAQAAGVEYVDEIVLDHFDRSGPAVRLEGRRAGRAFSVRARLVVDASGPRGFLWRMLRLPETAFPDLPRSEGLYTHFRGVARLEELPAFSSPEEPPYPIDDAAVHHVFEGGWVWILRFRSGLVSAGVAATPALAAELRLAEGEPAWARLLARFPSIGQQFADASPARPFVHAPALPFRAAAAAGPDWILLPSAAAFVDPMLSTGIPLTLLGIERLAGAVENEWGRPGWPRALAACGEATLFDADTAAMLVAALAAAYGDFEVFSRLALLYFAASIHAELGRRLLGGGRRSVFLSRDHPAFGPALHSCCATVIEANARGTMKRDRDRILAGVLEAIEPLDVAGLSDAARRNWHPVEAGPLLAGAAKLGSTPGEIAAMLARSGFYGEATVGPVPSPA
jgi:tetracycline 7-halogenase / FADH2 O2-dependent halogenase